MATGSSVVLLLWTLTAAISRAEEPEIRVRGVSDGVALSCGDGNVMSSSSGEPVLKLPYRDDSSGEFTCMVRVGEKEEKGSKIYVKFRTCDNCVQLDLVSIAGLAVGNLLATIVMGVAVYLIASHGQAGPITSQKRGSDRQLLVLNEGSSGASSDQYQRLHHKRDTYDLLSNRR